MEKYIFIDLLLEKYLKNDDINHDILEVTSHQFNPLWNNFQQIEQYYINNFYEYDLIEKNENVIYRERLNGEIINELEFEKTSADWYILEKANDSVVSFDDIRNSLKEHFMMEFLNVEIFNMIEELLSAHLIYTTDDYSEILTIIDINNVL
ncbi:hypothetical protein SDC9_87628 [bioreactor metagenome]|uniref:Uncharacterized protein n=1 Tax=bioreactor metagenome TaxID=1076179 RepID=A0A644ZJG2_9ZZZZ